MDTKMSFVLLGEPQKHSIIYIEPKKYKNFLYSKTRNRKNLGIRWENCLKNFICIDIGFLNLFHPVEKDNKFKGDGCKMAEKKKLFTSGSVNKSLDNK
jgi:hypothetical protein